MEQHLKERLVGAVVLIVAAVILIPIILSGSPSLEPVSGLEQDAETPTAGAGLQPFSSKIVPLGTTTQLGSVSPERKSTPAPATIPELSESTISSTRAVTAPQQPAQQQAVIKPVVVSAPAPSPALASAPAPAAASPGQAAQTKGWLVQLGSFSNARNAAGLKERLLKKAFPAFIRTSKTDNGEVTRVFVGPSASRQHATQLAARLFTETRLKGMVVRQP